MQAFELVEMLRDALNRLSKVGIRIDDYKHIAMFHEYRQLEAKNAKKAYILASLADKYNLSQRTLIRIVERLKKDAKE